MRTFTYTPISMDELTATDLRETTDYGTAYRITIYDEDGKPAAEHAEALFIDGRLGIAWGADATWADARSLESGIEMWLNDSDAWEAAN